jgi:hypothetical protein
VTYSSGDNFPIIPSGIGTFTSSITGVGVSLYVYYSATQGDKNINVVDCDNNVYCSDVVSAGNGVFTYEINTECNCEVNVVITDGACL